MQGALACHSLSLPVTVCQCVITLCHLFPALVASHCHVVFIIFVTSCLLAQALWKSAVQHHTFFRRKRPMAASPRAKSRKSISHVAETASHETVRVLGRLRKTGRDYLDWHMDRVLRCLRC